MTKSSRASVFSAAVLSCLALTSIQGQESASQRPTCFTTDVLPWLTRQGCAAAECHGGGTGRGGLKLSLFGGDPRADWQALAVDRGGRRVDTLAPEHSLLLRKPSRDLPHGGGLRLPRDSEPWQALRDWIAEGARFGTPGAVTIESLALRGVEDGARLQAKAEFVWTDPESGVLRRTVEDVTDRVTFASTAPDRVEVDRTGRVTVHGPGRALVSARLLNLGAELPIVTGFGEDVPADPADGVLDAAWRADLAALGLRPAHAAPDATLLRRLYLTLVGRPPTPSERDAWLATPASRRAETTARDLLDSDGFTAQATRWLAEWFEVPDPRTSPEHLRARDRGLRARLETLAANRGPLRDVLLAELRSDGPLLTRHADARDRAEFVGRAWLGIRLGCARCHDHPHDRWRRDDHLGFSAVFPDARPAAEGGMMRGVLFDEEASGRAVTPSLAPVVDVEPTAPQDLATLRGALRDDRRVARALTNRILAALLGGRGLVEPPDDHRATNPAALPGLLDAATDRLIALDFDLRAFVLEAVSSSWFALDSARSSDDPLDGARARYLARRTATALDEATWQRCVASVLGREPLAPPTDEAQSPLSLELARWHGAEIVQTLHGDRGGGDLVDALVDFETDDRARLEGLFVACLSRAPSDAEIEALLPRLTAAADPRAFLHRLAHALLASREGTSLR